MDEGILVRVVYNPSLLVEEGTVKSHKGPFNRIPAPTITLLWVVLGLALIGIWTDVVGYSVNLFPAEAAGEVEPTNRDAFQLGRLFMGTLFFIFAARLPKIQSTLIGIVVVVMSTSTGFLIISYHQTLIDPQTLAFAGTFLSSAGYTMMTWIFYLFCARNIQTERVVWCIAISLILETTFSILFSLYLPVVLQMIIVVILPILTALCYFMATHSGYEKEHYLAREAGSLGEKTTTGFDKYALLAQVAVFTIALVFIRVLSNVGIWGETRGNFTGMTELSVSELTIISFLVLLMTYLVFYLPRKKLSLSFRCIIGFAVILGGLQVLGLSDQFQFNSIFDSLTTAMELFSHLVRWMIVIECVRSITTPDYRITGFSNIVSVMFSLLWAHVLSTLGFATSTFVMLVVYGLLVVVLGLYARSFLRQDFLVPQQKAETERAALAAFALERNLTQRESEIFALLMMGKRRHEIEEECELSEGTVKTHISNIYKKLDVHSKRDMVKLFESRDEG
jgi:DNA-binding CsgD family transcriptional regulator